MRAMKRIRNPRISRVQTKGTAPPSSTIMAMRTQVIATPDKDCDSCRALRELNPDTVYRGDSGAAQGSNSRCRVAMQLRREPVACAVRPCCQGLGAHGMCYTGSRDRGGRIPRAALPFRVRALCPGDDRPPFRRACARASGRRICMIDRHDASPHSRFATVPFAGETNNDYRARIAHQQADLQMQRQRELLEQASTLNAPTARIRIWERLHQLSLPRDPNHRLVGIIAANTGLTMDEVRDEQRLRVAPPVVQTAV